MRTTADIAAILTIIVMGLILRRRQELINRQAIAIRDLVKVNERLFQKIDTHTSER